MKLLYFTATGNCLHVAKSLGGELLSIPQLIKENQYEIEDDVIGIIFPTFYVDVPDFIANYLKKLIIKSEYLFGIATCGYFSGNVMDQLQKINPTLKFNYTNTLIMVDNYLPVYDMEKEKQRESNAQIDKNIDKIKEDIKSRVNFKIKTKLLVALISNLNRRKIKSKDKDFDKNFTVNDSCTKCKICETVCPKKNIMVNDIPEFQGNCAACLACIHACPQNSIHLQQEKSKHRFRNTNIHLKEIIQANKQ